MDNTDYLEQQIVDLQNQIYNLSAMINKGNFSNTYLLTKELVSQFYNENQTGLKISATGEVKMNENVNIGGTAFVYDSSSTSLTINGTPVNLNFKPDYGDGTTGDDTIVGTESLTADTYYNNLTVPAGTILELAGYRLYVAGTLTNAGTIRRNGNNGTNGSTDPAAGGAALSDVNLGGSGAGGDGRTSQAGIET